MTKQVLLLLLAALMIPGGLAEQVAQPADPSVLRYQATVETDPETGIQRTTLDPQGYDLEVYFEIPVFAEDGEGYAEINRFFQQLNDGFFSPENGNLSSIWECATNPEASYTPYCYTHRAAVNTQTEELVSVTISYEWYAGGVGDYGSDSYTFRTGTGELLRLTDVADGTEEELRAMIGAALKEQDAGTGAVNTDLAWNRELDGFEFYVKEDRIYLPFDKYEASYGAYGAFEVELPARLK